MKIIDVEVLSVKPVSWEDCGLGPKTRKLKIAGGYLYIVELYADGGVWSAPTFVPEVK